MTDPNWQRKKDGMKNDAAFYTLLLNDLRVAAQAWSDCLHLSEAMDRGSSVWNPPWGFQLMAHLTTFVVTYGRLFTGEERHLLPRAPWVTKDELPMHSYVMDLRHEMVAHTKRSRRLLSFRLPRHPVGPGSPRFGLHSLQLEFAPPGPIESVAPMLRRMETEIETALRGAIEALDAHCGADRDFSTPIPFDEF